SRIHDAAAGRGVRVFAAEPAAAPRLDRVAGVGAVATLDVPAGTLTVAGSAAAAGELAVADFVAARAAGRAAVLVAPAVELAAVDAAVRGGLREAGVLGRDEVGGLAAGDVLRFTARRTSLGVAAHDMAQVAAVDTARERVTLVIAGSPPVEVARRSLVAVRRAHAVPPWPQLIAGRGEVYVLGECTVAARHRSAPLHEYITAAAVDPAAPPLPGLRYADLAEIEARTAAARGVAPTHALEAQANARVEAVVEAALRSRAPGLGVGPPPPEPAGRDAWRSAARLAAIERELGGGRAGPAREPERRERARQAIALGR